MKKKKKTMVPNKEWTSFRSRILLGSSACSSLKGGDEDKLTGMKRWCMFVLLLLASVLLSTAQVQLANGNLCCDSRIVGLIEEV